MIKSKFEYFKDTNIKFIDGDRGTNYPSKSEFFKEGHCLFLDTKNVTEVGFKFDKAAFISKEKDQLLGKGKLQRGDIVLTSRGTIGNVAFYGNDIPYEDIRINSGMLIVRSDANEYSPYYLYIFLRSNIFKRQYERISSGSAQPQLPVHSLKNVSILKRDLNTQRKIEECIRCLDDKIKLNSKIESELEEMTELIYNYWFIQFDFPDENGKPYKSSGGKMVYNKDLKQEVPYDWEVCKLRKWLTSEKSGDWGKESSQNNYTLKVTCIRGSDLGGLNGDEEEKAPIRFIHQKNKDKILSNFEMVIEISGGSPTQSTGRIAAITSELKNRFHYPLICSNFCKAITMKDNDYFYNFFYQWKRFYKSGLLFRWEGKTSGIKNLLFDNFVDNFKTTKPPKEIAINFNKLVLPLEQKRQMLLAEIKELKSLRDWLLPMLMNGQITVSK